MVEFHVRLKSKALAEKLQKAAEERGETRNALIEDVLTAFIQDRDEAKAELRRRLGDWLSSD